MISRNDHTCQKHPIAQDERGTYFFIYFFHFCVSFLPTGSTYPFSSLSESVLVYLWSRQRFLSCCLTELFTGLHPVPCLPHFTWSDTGKHKPLQLLKVQVFLALSILPLCALLCVSFFSSFCLSCIFAYIIPSVLHLLSPFRSGFLERDHKHNDSAEFTLFNKNILAITETLGQYNKTEKIINKRKKMWYRYFFIPGAGQNLRWILCAV